MAYLLRGGGDYKNEIVWQRTATKGDAKGKFGAVHDVILYYVRSQSAQMQQIFVEKDADYISRFTYDDKDGKGLYRLAPLDSPNPRPNLTYEYKGYKPPAKGWRVSRELMEQLDVEGRLAFPKSINGRIARKHYLSEQEGRKAADVWTDIAPLQAAATEKLGYPTQKPEALLERIISASSNEGDTVLDAYCGCGTSVVVAQRLKRQWIGIDITYQSIALVVKRLEDSFGKAVSQEIELNGVPRDMESVLALVNKRDDRVRKEFEKWAVLTYSDNRAVINEKKGADKGVDGVAYVAVGRDAEKKDIKHLPVMLSVKSGKVGAGIIRDLRGVVEREGAAGGILLTLEEPTRPMLEEARQAGQFKGDFATFDRLQIVTVRQILDGERMHLPLLAEVAKRARSKSDAKQMGMYTEE